MGAEEDVLVEECFIEREQELHMKYEATPQKTARHPDKQLEQIL
jgi:hypothetical protein